MYNHLSKRFFLFIIFFFVIRVILSENIFTTLDVISTLCEFIETAFKRSFLKTSFAYTFELLSHDLTNTSAPLIGQYSKSVCLELVAAFTLAGMNLRL